MRYGILSCSWGVVNFIYLFYFKKFFFKFGEWATYRLVKGLGGADHLVKHLPGLLWAGDDKLLDLFKLVDTEDAPGILAVRAGLLAEAGRETAVAEGELLGVKPPFFFFSNQGF